MSQQSSKLKLVKIIAPLVILSLIVITYFIWGTNVDFKSVDFFQGILVGLFAVFIGVWTVVLISTIIKLSSKSHEDQRSGLIKKLYQTIGMLSFGLGFLLLQLHMESIWIYGLIVVLFIAAIIFNVGFFFRAKDN